ncbi:MAG: hypothetical protein QOG06_2138 [Gaiellaceae bacterium]|jgi:hypothetical protein|nr:hypothetical protein [Gaiellaceae bacterium]
MLTGRSVVRSDTLEVTGSPAPVENSKPGPLAVEGRRRDATRLLLIAAIAVEVVWLAILGDVLYRVFLT